MNYLETIEARAGRKAGDIDAGVKLYNWYGVNSLASHVLRPLSDTTAEAYFVVGENLCGPKSRPPMFDRLVFFDGSFITRTEPRDAREHFNEAVGFKVVPGHNLAGLVVEGMDRAYAGGLDGGRLYLSGFDFMRYKGLVLPDQNIEIAGPIRVDDKSVTFSPTITREGERKVLGRNFRCEVTDPINKGEEVFMLSQHWLIEAAAQGLGILATMSQNAKEVVPVLMELSQSTFTSTLIKAGDIVVSRLTILSSDEKAAMGNIEQFVLGSTKVANQTKMMVGFSSIEDIQRRIVA